ncbi:STM4011 family radical SAM protein [Dactylosporangium aurantiacum]|uniref:STM4011 family radical SAM protein n=1 Tax=Dactylosporangium aurantiacum TaxID=35754 RepID=A0A9Q9MFS9_9ACTN|nr:STM4011 family radical SAM protein [Dactylosporangium aurantiacum]MDG6102799.1 STM4011 family radical SAM protein [Dactylosporangium aurantiacum]UWZ52960.1 STM4011 family radical SAM protein [Dactylosporangium aurantiacum]
MRILYRGPLASCNYDCAYCPFAKRRDPPGLLRADRAALERFVGWVEAHPDEPTEVLFTPWGEGLTRSWYRAALIRLSHLPHVGRAAIQTNLAGRLDWVTDADPGTLALWCTFHPGQVSLERFLRQAATLHRHGIRHSVGVVGLPAHHADAVALRSALPSDVYVWINAADGHTYTPQEEAAWTAIDPWFGYSVRPHPSLGRSCRTGDEVISVLGDGTVRRCHFVQEPLGNLYDGSWRPTAAPCPKRECDCHIGYVHLRTLPLYEVFAGGVLERVPHELPLWSVPPASLGEAPAGPGW